MYNDINMTKVMFGERAVHVPLNMIIQPVEKNIITGVFQSKHSTTDQLLFGSKKTHTLIIGDIVFRPHLVVSSDHLVGEGLTGIARSGFNMGEWADKGDVLFCKEQINGRKY